MRNGTVLTFIFLFYFLTTSNVSSVEANDNASQLSQNFKNNFAKTKSFMRFYKMGMAEAGAGNHRQALTYHEKALNEALSRPTQAMASSKMAESHEALKHFNEAIKYYDFAVKATMNDVQRKIFLDKAEALRTKSTSQS